VPCYNNVELSEATIQSVLENTTGDYELILVNNHSPDKRTVDRLELIKTSPVYAERVKVVDPGKNIGCHQAVNFGLQHASGDWYVKLDDDTTIKTPGWNETLINAYRKWNITQDIPMAFIAPDSNVRQVTSGYKYTIDDIHYEIVTSGVLGFSLVMFHKSIYDLFGPLECKFWKDGDIKRDSLYGGEELYYAQKAQKNGMIYGYCLDVLIHHADNEQRDLDYVVWKFYYAFAGKTDKDLEEYKKDKAALIAGYKMWMQYAPDNEWIQTHGRKRLDEINSRTEA
jgi:glycosyltransferase involved in cell wall biosynthesis